MAEPIFQGLPDLNEPAVEIDLDQPVVRDEINQGVFDLNKPLFWGEVEEDDGNCSGSDDGHGAANFEFGVDADANGGDANGAQRDGHGAGADADGHADVADGGVGEDGTDGTCTKEETNEDGHVDVEVQNENCNGDGHVDSTGGVATNRNGHRRRNFLSDDDRRAIWAMILERSTAGSSRDGVIKSIALVGTGVPLRVVQRIWTTGKRGGGVHAVCSKRTKNCGRKRINIDPQAIRDVPLRNRTSLRDLAQALSVSKSTVFGRFKEGKIRRHTNDRKFTLTDGNKIAPIMYSTEEE